MRALDVDFGQVGARRNRSLEREQRVLRRAVRARPMRDHEKVWRLRHAFERGQRGDAVDHQGGSDEERDPDVR